MTRKKVMGRCQVTCGRDTPSPYLVKQWDNLLDRRLMEGMRALDLGCGGGRNTRFLKSKGLEVEDIDVCHPDSKHRYNLGTDIIPVKAGSVDLILLNYVLMFLTEGEMAHLAEEVRRVAKMGCIIVIEMYPAKDSHFRTEDLCEKGILMFKRFLLPYQNWKTIHRVKLRQVWERISEADS